MKKRISGKKVVVFGFSGSLQDDLDRYQGIMQIASAADWQVLVLQEHFELHLRGLLEAETIDGVIGEFISESWLRSLPQSVPVVHIGQASFSDAVASVMFDPFLIGKMGRDHLKKAGYLRHCLYTPSARGVLTSRYAEGFLSAGSTADVVLHGPSELSRYLQDYEVSTGIFCLSDYDSRSVIACVQSAGLDIPSQVGVLGLGDRLWDRIAAGVEMSSIPLPQIDLGLQAGVLLRELMAGEPARSLRLTPQSVVPRASTMRNLGSGGGLVQRVEALFLENLGADVSVRDLCVKLRVSQRTVELAFRRSAHGTPYQHLLQLRLEEACRLLRETDLRINQIGERVGYPVPQQFSTFFVARQGVSASHYRLTPGVQLGMEQR